MHTRFTPRPTSEKIEEKTKQRKKYKLLPSLSLHYSTIERNGLLYGQVCTPHTGWSREVRSQSTQWEEDTPRSSGTITQKERKKKKKKRKEGPASTHGRHGRKRPSLASPVQSAAIRSFFAVTVHTQSPQRRCPGSPRASPATQVTISLSLVRAIS